jgi:hypothetical protein
MYITYPMIDIVRTIKIILYCEIISEIILQFFPTNIPANRRRPFQIRALTNERPITKRALR